MAAAIKLRASMNAAGISRWAAAAMF